MGEQRLNAVEVAIETLTVVSHAISSIASMDMLRIMAEATTCTDEVGSQNKSSRAAHRKAGAHGPSNQCHESWTESEQCKTAKTLIFLSRCVLLWYGTNHRRGRNEQDN